MSKVIRFRVSEWEFKKLKHQADAKGLTLSDLIRQSIKYEKHEKYDFHEALNHLEKDIIFLQWALEKTENFVCACVCFITENYKKQQKLLNYEGDNQKCHVVEKRNGEGDNWALPSKPIINVPNAENGNSNS